MAIGGPGKYGNCHEERAYHSCQGEEDATQAIGRFDPRGQPHGHRADAEGEDELDAVPRGAPALRCESGEEAVLDGLYVEAEVCSLRVN
jgi:hypothetical protein